MSGHRVRIASGLASGRVSSCSPAGSRRRASCARTSTPRPCWPARCPRACRCARPGRPSRAPSWRSARSSWRASRAPYPQTRRRGRAGGAPRWLARGACATRPRPAAAASARARSRSARAPRSARRRSSALALAAALGGEAWTERALARRPRRPACSRVGAALVAVTPELRPRARPRCAPTTSRLRAPARLAAPRTLARLPRSPLWDRRAARTSPPTRRASSGATAAGATLLPRELRGRGGDRGVRALPRAQPQRRRRRVRRRARGARARADHGAASETRSLRSRSAALLLVRSAGRTRTRSSSARCPPTARGCEAAPRASPSTSTRSSRRTSARCASSTPPATRSRPARRSGPTATTRRWRSRCSPDLPEGTYTATYRIISADSHPVAGAISFAIGDPAAGAPPPARRAAAAERQRQGDIDRLLGRPLARLPRARRSRSASPFFVACVLVAALADEAGGGERVAARVGDVRPPRAAAGRRARSPSARSRASRAAAGGRQRRRHDVLGGAEHRPRSTRCSTRASAR